MSNPSSSPISGVVRGAGNRELTVALLVAALLAWLWLPFARIGVDVHHDGIMLKPALDVLSGQVLFRDSFNQYGALTVYLHALGLWIYPSLLTLKVMSVLATVLSLLIFYAAWREVLPAGLAIAAGAMYVGFIPFFDPEWMLIPWSSDFAMLFQAVALYALFRVLTGSSVLIWATTLGVACAAVFWCRQPVGVLLAVAVAVILGASFWAGWRLPNNHWSRAVGGVVAGFVAVNGAMFYRIFSQGAFAAWWEQNILWPRRWAFDSSKLRGVAWEPFFRTNFEPVILVALAAGLALLLAPWIMLRRPKSRGQVFVLTGYYLVVGLAACLGWWRWREWFIVPHAGWVALIFLVVLVYTIASFLGAFRMRLKIRDAGSKEFFLIAGLTGVSLASLPQIFPVGCARHFFWALAPVFGLVVHALWRWSGVRPLVVSAAVVVLLIPTLHDKRGWGGYTLRQPLVTITEPALLAGMKVSATERDLYRDLDRFYALVESRRPGTPVAMFGDDAMLVCLARDRTNPGPYFVTWRGLITKRDSLARWTAIMERRPLVMVNRYSGGNLGDFLRREAYMEVWRRERAGLVFYAPKEWAEALSAPIPESSL